MAVLPGRDFARRTGKHFVVAYAASRELTDSEISLPA